MKKFTLSIFILISLISFNDFVIFDGFFKEFTASGFLVMVNLTRLEQLEKNIACYYNQNNKFPIELKDFKYYIDS